MSKLFETTVIRLEALSNSFEFAVRSMSNSVTECMKELHSTMSTLDASIFECQQQVVKLNEPPMLEIMTRALWTVEQEKKDEERRSRNLIISGLELQTGSNNKDVVSSLCENHLTVKPQIAKTRVLGTPESASH
ncbi:hypothetical protein HELRODRAFT_164142 [Helobdella robusta]|uniref:Uncharacterized protein n=1 Tax=Helobdella robusta TaxID=6412 RepID=T1EUZ8_HELRO|nr:hypothetical protein HELRODRAFT_164142 [Helobdella robusta]ESN94321.1 hypothetical protein HELRODRAFT_164142 [Helobdella robusta]